MYGMPSPYAQYYPNYPAGTPGPISPGPPGQPGDAAAAWQTDPGYYGSYWGGK